MQQTSDVFAITALSVSTSQEGTHNPLWHHPSVISCLHSSQDGYSGYEFEARLHFKVHAALNLLR